MKATYKSYKDLGLECLIVMGGDGTLSTAQQMQEYGFNIIGIPKSIDNDLFATDYTFGFQTAVEIVNESLERLHTTASSHDRIMVLEVMGRGAGRIALNGGIAGGANIILMPEIPFSYKKLLEHLKQRQKIGRTSSVIIVAEGAKAHDGEVVLKNIGGHANEILYGGIGDSIVRYINENSDLEARSTSLGHIQRGGSPNAFDKLLSTQFGSFVGKMVQEKKYGHMVAVKNNEMVSIPLNDAVCKIKNVDPHAQIIELAKDVGVYFGE